MEIIKSDKNFDFLGKRKIFITMSLVLIGIGILSLILRGGPRYGIEFAGGAMVQVAFQKDVAIDEVRKALSDKMESTPVVQAVVGKDREFIILTEKTTEDMGGAQTLVGEILGNAFGKDSVSISQAKMVGPKVGAELREKGLIAILISIAAMLTYIWIRFEFDFGMGAIAALVHDVLIMVGYFSLLNKEFDLTFVAALLTIVGFSVNDTVVIFDRVRELLARSGGKGDIAKTLNRAVNECMSRTIITSLTVLLSSAILFLFGGSVIHDFATALLVGLVFGTYSSIFIASPVVLGIRNWQAKRKSAPATA